MKTVVTVHDFLHERYQAFMNPTGLLSGSCAEKKDVIESASVIVSVSGQTKQDILHYTSVDASLIHVIHHGYSSQLSSPCGDDDDFVKRERLSTRFWLYLGRGEFYKNFDLCFYAWVQCAKSGSDADLLVIGPASPLEERHFDYLARRGLEERIHTLVNASDNDLRCAYAGALALIYSSLHEGFGIPLLEAMAAGCPVLCSDIPVFHEVAGDAALYFDPHSVNDLLEKMRKMANDGTIRDDLIARGRNRVTLFSWDEAAHKLAGVYRAVHGA